ncbi:MULTISPECIES: hypothetical protein [Methylobacterium]|uniref:hypothetical protein n=1 Tax=Methylobacterium TaxID=407 RepID=UPI0002EFE3CA|nr:MULTISPECIES: hypothetical protein [Methylobacterium]GAN50555.1 hypothetical protein ME121_4602 [Methylobacterium sp. ME121]KIU31365.1 hypothetical protein SR39_17730 [Methylobacterium radiotolerans]MCX4198617.1 hypothetical protein [Methylobacterium organophilum]MDE3750059.1 hypothetical protein [Methylobacterium radiotolerans]OXE38963.1 hypothetical protein CCS92_26710 [Methylobacterium radiotolerans]
MTGSKDERAERLKAALRQNLRRRKAQDRGRAEARPSPGADQSCTRESDGSGPDSDKSGL